MRAGRIAVDAYGLPLLGLTVLGVAVAWPRRRDRLTLALAAGGISCAVFLASRVLAPVDAPFQRYADEFIHRVYGMTLPAVAILLVLGIVNVRGRITPVNVDDPARLQLGRTHSTLATAGLLICAFGAAVGWFVYSNWEYLVSVVKVSGGAQANGEVMMALLKPGDTIQTPR